MDDQVTIIIDSFDGYSDVWPYFFKVFEKNWPDCPYPVKLVSNHKVYPGIDTILTGDEISWTDRTLKAIEQVDSEYIILLLEDYFLGSRIDTSSIEHVINYLDENKGKYLRFTAVPVSRFNTDGKEIYPLYADEEYAVNLQASVWNREFLISCLKKYSGNAWMFEVGLLQEAVKAEHIELDGCYAMEHDPLDIRNGILKGKWYPKTVKFLKGMDISVDFTVRGKLPFGAYCKYNISMGIKNRISYDARKKLKRFLSKLGFKFVSEF